MRKTTIALTLIAALFTGCAHNWTEAEREQLRARNADKCKPLPGHKVLWCAESGQPMPIELERAIKKKEPQ